MHEILLGYWDHSHSGTKAGSWVVQVPFRSAVRIFSDSEGVLHDILSSIFPPVAQNSLSGHNMTAERRIRMMMGPLLRLSKLQSNVIRDQSFQMENTSTWY
jgi:hypothetical protein